MTPALHLRHPRCSASFAARRERPYLRTVCKASRTQRNLHVSQQQQTCILLSQSCVAWPASSFLSRYDSPNFGRTCGCSFQAIATDDSSQMTIRIFSLDVAHDVPGVTTG